MRLLLKFNVIFLLIFLAGLAASAYVSRNLLLDNAGFSSHLDAGGAMQRYLGLSPDGREAKRAFNEKRKPVFTGAYPKPTE